MIERFLVSCVRSVLAHRVSTIVVVVAITGVFAFLLATRLRIDNSSEAFLPSESPAAVALRELHQDFGRDDVFQVVVAGDVFSLPYLERLRSMEEEISAIEVPAHEARPEIDVAEGDLVPAVEEAISLASSRIVTTGPDGDVRFERLFEPWPTADGLPEVRARALSDSRIVGQLVGSGATHSVLFVRPGELSEQETTQLYRAIEAIAERHQSNDFQIAIAGLPAMNATLNDRMLLDLGITGAISTTLLLLLLFASFRTPLGVIAPWIVLGLSNLWMLGWMAALGAPFTLVAGVLPVFILCVGIGDAIHLQSGYRALLQKGMPAEDAILEAVRSAGPPVLFTTVTTALGLMSFEFSEIESLRDVGRYGAFGIFAALALSLTLLPLLLVRDRVPDARPERESAPGLVDRMLAWCNRCSLPVPGDRSVSGRAARTLLVAIGCVVLALVGARNVGPRHDPLTWMSPQDPLRAAYDQINEHVGGSGTVTLLVEAKPGEDLRRLETVRALERLQDHIATYEDPRHPKLVGASIGLIDLLRAIRGALNDGDETLPTTQRGIHDLFTVAETMDRDVTRQIVSLNATKAVITFRIAWLDASAYGPLTEHIERGVSKHVGDRAVVRVTGSVFNFFSVVRLLIKEMVRSFGLALVFITIAIAVMVRSLRTAALALVPNLMPIVIVLGGMGALGIPIDLSNVVVSSIALGIIVDDTIHFLHHYRKERQAGSDVDDAIEVALRRAGRAMVATTAILAGGFFSYLAAGLASTARFGVLIASIVLVALLADLILLPALLRLGDRGVRVPENLLKHEPVRGT